MLGKFKIKTIYLLLCSIFLALVACGDETNVVQVTNEIAGVAVEVLTDSLGACDSASVGKDDANGTLCISASSYDTTKQFCQDGILYALCNDEKYNPMIEYCDGGTVYEGKGKFMDARDGQIYKTAKIGSQIWMAENLNYDYNQNTAKSYCYNDNADYCAKYGRLYTWAAAMDSAAVFSDDGKGCGYGLVCTKADTVRGVCPEGWHLPDSAEWKMLKKFVADSLYGGKTDSVGYALKAINDWYDNGNGSDAFGFRALPAGYYSYDGTFRKVFYRAFFVSSSENGVICPRLGLLFYYDTDLRLGGEDFKDDAFSVRCVKD